jgi:3D (Asp-Asp-Asp) domain-containing protein/uncharacterized protein YabE (DUF348 family)
MYVPVMADADTKTIFFIDNGVSTPYNTSAETVSEFFDERGVALTPRDTLNMEYSDPLESGSKIEIKRGFYINVSIDGNIDRFKVSQNTSVGAFIRMFETERQKNYYYSGSLINILNSDEMVYLTAYREETVTVEEEIPFDIQTQETADLIIGTEKVAQEGQPGKKISVYKVLFLGDAEQSRELISEDTVVASLPEIILAGTARPSPTPVPKSAVSDNLGVEAAAVDFGYSQVYTMVATAYTAGPESTGKSPGMAGYGITASGMRVRPGVVSVDPQIIPLGTRLYVEGYGYSLAADTGGAIKGNRIDVYMETLSEAYRWGRRTVRVYILD